MLKTITLCILALCPSLIYSSSSYAAGENFINSIGMEFVYIKQGSFQMGSPDDDHLRAKDEIYHQVTLTKGYYLQTTETTQGQWKSVMEKNPSNFKDCGEACPVENVSWVDVQEFIHRLNKKEKTNSYRLPTEAEWEYACRADSNSPFAFGKHLNRNHANFDDSFFLFGIQLRNFQGKTIPAGSLPPNQFGLYDMHGNVWEWCQDRYGKYTQGAVIDPAGASQGRNRVNRGGSWVSSAGDCRCAKRYGNGPDYRNDLIGFRLVNMQ